MLYESVSALAYASSAVLPLEERASKPAWSFLLFSISFLDFLGHESLFRVKAVAGRVAVGLCWCTGGRPCFTGQTLRCVWGRSAAFVGISLAGAVKFLGLLLHCLHTGSCWCLARLTKRVAHHLPPRGDCAMQPVPFFWDGLISTAPWHRAPATFAAGFCSLGIPKGLCPCPDPQSCHRSWCLGTPFLIWWLLMWLGLAQSAPCSRRCLLAVAGSMLPHDVVSLPFCRSAPPFRATTPQQKAYGEGMRCWKGPALVPANAAWHEAAQTLPWHSWASLKVNQWGDQRPSLGSPPLVPEHLQAPAGCAEGVDILAVVVARQQICRW